jgi:hypothetical protein
MDTLVSEYERNINKADEFYNFTRKKQCFYEWFKVKKYNVHEKVLETRLYLSKEKNEKKLLKKIF